MFYFYHIINQIKHFRYVYIFCEKAERNDKGGWDYEVKPYKPANYLLQDIALRLVGSKAPWDSYVNEGKLFKFIKK